MVKTLFHGSRDYFEDVLLYKCCDIGFHCGTLEQALYRILDGSKTSPEVFFCSYVYEIELNIDDKTLLELPDCMTWADIKKVKEEINKKYPYLNLDSIKTIIELREYFLNMGIKNIAYENKCEGKGMSYIILDDNDLNFTIKRYTVREIINKINRNYEKK